MQSLFLLLTIAGAAQGCSQKLISFSGYVSPLFSALPLTNTLMISHRSILGPDWFFLFSHLEQLLESEIY